MSTILIAYERDSEQLALDKILTSRGYNVVRCGNGLDALDQARREPPALIVSDILLPKMDGIALCRKWKHDERLRTVPFIFYSTRYGDPKYERFAQELGVERFLSRPAPQSVSIRPKSFLNRRESFPRCVLRSFSSSLVSQATWITRRSPS